MRQLYQLPLLGLLLVFLIPSQLCKICEVKKDKQFYLNSLLSTMNNSKYTNGVQTANVLLSLRLVGIQSQNLQQKLIQELQEYVSREGNLSSGQLAWTIMALGACHNPDGFGNMAHLVKMLEEKFQEEIENMGTHNGNPLTNFYQLSQDVLALCLFNGNYSVAEIADFFNPENKNYYFGGQFSVDTGAMAVLALTCVKRSKVNLSKIDTNIATIISSHIETLIEKILSEKKDNGLIGNIYSTGEAMQALFVSSDYYQVSEWNCQQTLNTVLKEISQGTFNVPTAAAQILPALMKKTYLDVNKDAPCPGIKLNVSIPVSGSAAPTTSPSFIHVHYSVKIVETYSTNVTVLNGSVFLDVMEEAQKQNKTIFGFTMKETSWGPYITSVQGLKANSNDRTYWEILSGGISLSQGVGSYVVHDGEYLEIRWSKY
ncbi:PREDICTED: transcobalamin-1 [Chrysochloris asiatica]|uniref:Transcobalamin-1 n=1 Tax=Chrysochloris asiatica TaxID=185453 RepID=A0A9B0U687_CHRAS|nr:PREDICTED: transcobalamin-1 [Chrysochloris asiatica]